MLMGIRVTTLEDSKSKIMEENRLSSFRESICCTVFGNTSSATVVPETSRPRLCQESLSGLFSRSLQLRSRTVDVHCFVCEVQNKASFCSNTSPMSRRSARTTSTHTLLSHFPRQASAPPWLAREAEQILRYSTPFPGV